MSPTTSSFRKNSDRLPLKKRCSPSIVSTTKRSKRKYSKREAKSKRSMMNQKHGRWTADERRSFLFGLKSHGKGKWSLIAKSIPTRSTVQVKTHAQLILRRIENGEDVFEALDDKTKLTTCNDVEAGPSPNHDDLEDLENVLSDNMDHESYMDAYNDDLDDDSDNDMPSRLDTDIKANKAASSNDADRQEDHPDFLADYNTALQSASSRVATPCTMPTLPVSSAYKIAPRPHYNNSFGPQPRFASLVHPQVPSSYSPFPSQSNGGNECDNGYHHCRTPASYHPFQATESSPFQPWSTYSTNAVTPATPSTNGTVFSHFSSPSPTMVNNCYTHYVPNIATVTNTTHPIDADDTKRKSDILPKGCGSKYNHSIHRSSFEKNTYHHKRSDGDDIDDESSEIAHILLGMSSPQPLQTTVFEV